MTSHFFSRHLRILASSLVCTASSILAVFAADQPQWGEAWSRNQVSGEKGLPDTFDPATGRNIKWSAKLGTETHSTPVVAGGRVLIGTNNGNPRDPRHQGDRGVLMCLDERDGSLVWQLVVPKRIEDQFMDWPRAGMSSPATVEDGRVYMVSNRGEVMCLDMLGLANGNDGPFQDEAAHLTLGQGDALTPGPLDADILWTCDLMAQAGIWPHDAAHSSIMIRGPHLYVNSGTGVDNTHRKIRTPDAPSLLVLDKATGALLARDDEKIAPNIFHCTWSSPSLGRVAGREVIFFCGGNGLVYGFDPLPLETKPGGGMQKLRKVFEYDPDPTSPKTEVHRFTTNKQEGPSNIYAMPVFVDQRLYIAFGGDIFWGKNEALLHCLEPRASGTGLEPNRLWKYPLVRHVLSTPAISGGLVFIADIGRTLHCLDAATGSMLWTHEMKGDFWASPTVADGKVYIGTRQGDFAILAATREKKVLCSLELKSPISATVTAANGTLYVATMNMLYAIAAQ